MCLCACVAQRTHSLFYLCYMHLLGKECFDVEGRPGDQITRDVLGNSEESPVIALEDRGSSQESKHRSPGA